jgi:hypothetical protein
VSVPYPSEENLERIHTWDFRDVRGLFDFIENDEGMRMYGSFKRTTMPDGKERIRIATGGWSGNEDMMSALERNFVVYGSYWKLSARGGLEVYIIPAPKEEP